MTDVELDARVTALEENGGGGSQNGIFLSEFVIISSLKIIDEFSVLLQKWYH